MEAKIEEKKQKKFRPIKKLNEWWDGLGFNKQLYITCGIWALDGVLWGKAISDVINEKKMKKSMEGAYILGKKDGNIEAYKEMAQTNPFADFKPTETKKF